MTDEPETTHVSAGVELLLQFHVDGADYWTVYRPEVPRGKNGLEGTFLRSVELRIENGIPVARWPLYHHGRGLHTICQIDGDGVEQVEA